MRRREAIALFASAAVMPSCGRSNAGSIAVGSKNFTEDITIAEIYAAALERAGLKVDRRMNLGATQIALAAMRRGDIDLYPEYTGTGLIDVLHLPPMHDARALYGKVSSEFARRFDITWLDASPVNDSQGLATTRAVAARYNLRTLSDCARAAPKLRFAAVPEFVARADALPGLQKAYGGFEFAQVRIYTIGLQYAALQRGEADVCAVFTTDSQIEQQQLTVLQDDRSFWPPYNVAPIVRTPVLRAHPQIAVALNRVAPLLTDAAVRRLNVSVNARRMDPADAAAEFLRSV
ncbi:MAG TPA: glycine betaine ABC transporter substrate-binding protein [Candidatus Baltobacteraceae bacterium]|nr:glycine betaine ABC transporter substrate-binding protein [Candidatus Baltobacteraceae bacterium]